MSSKKHPPPTFAHHELKAGGGWYETLELAGTATLAPWALVAISIAVQLFWSVLFFRIFAAKVG